MANHQSPNQESELLWRFGNVIADQIIRTVNGPVVLCYSGMSGCGTATALMLALEDNRFWKHPIGMLYARKKDQEPRKPACSWHNIALPNSTYIFVDDHIGAGNTFNRARNALREEVPNMIYKYGKSGNEPPNGDRCYETDHEGKPVVWPDKREDWKPEITLIAVRQHGLERIKPPSGRYLIDPQREVLFLSEVIKQPWFRKGPGGQATNGIA